MKIKKYWKEAVIVLLLIFSMNKCTQSCSRLSQINKDNKELEKKDSIIKSLNDSIIILDTQNKVLNTTVSGNKELIDKLGKANEQISAAKKNINVNIKK